MIRSVKGIIENKFRKLGNTSTGIFLDENYDFMIRFNSGRISRANLSGLIASLMRHIKTLTMQVNCNLFQLMLISLQVQPKCILSNCPIIVIALYLLDVIHPLFRTVERPHTHYPYPRMTPLDKAVNLSKIFSPSLFSHF